MDNLFFDPSPSISPQQFFALTGRSNSPMVIDDHAMLQAALPLYDVRYAWCQGAQGEPHNWKPESMAGGKAA